MVPENGWIEHQANQALALTCTYVVMYISLLGKLSLETSQAFQKFNNEKVSL